jgi:hypothetical protein
LLGAHAKNIIPLSAPEYVGIFNMLSMRETPPSRLDDGVAAVLSCFLLPASVFLRNSDAVKKKEGTISDFDPGRQSLGYCALMDIAWDA